MRKSNRSLPFKRSLRNFDKELEEAKIYFYIYEDTKKYWYIAQYFTRYVPIFL